MGYAGEQCEVCVRQAQAHRRTAGRGWAAEAVAPEQAAAADPSWVINQEQRLDMLHVECWMTRQYKKEWANRKLGLEVVWKCVLESTQVSNQET
jgi:hypothetical protein